MKKTEKKGVTGVSLLSSAIIGFLTIILPLIYFKNILDPVLFPRLLFLNIFLATIYAFTFKFYHSAFYDFSILRKAIFYLLFGYFVITVISGTWAINFREGIFDMVKTFDVFALVAIVAVIFNSENNWEEKLVKFVIIAALIASIIGFYDYFQKVVMAENPFLADGRPVEYSVTGLMAHKNQFSISLMLMLPFAGFGIIGLNGKWKWAAIIAVVFIFLLILLLKTRSVWIALAVSACFIVVMIGIYGGNHLFDKKFAIKTLVVSFVVFMSASVIIRFFAHQYPNTQIGEVSEFLDFYSAKNYNRFKIYNITTEMIADHPITGVGAGNWKIHSQKYFNQYHFEKDQLNWIRPHNDYLWIMAEKGIVGILVFIGVFAFSLFYITKILISNISRTKKLFALLLAGGLVSYMVVSLFSFPVERINQQVYLSLLLASVIVIYHQAYPSKPLTINKKLIFVVILPVLLFGTVYSFSVVNMEMMVKKARKEQFRSNWPGLLSVSGNIPQTFKNIDADGKPIPWYAGLAYTRLQDFANAIKQYEKAVAILPNDSKILNNLGQAYIETGNYDKGLEMCSKALEILPYYPEALVNSATALLKTKQYQKSLGMLFKIREHDLTKPINQLKNKVIMQDAFVTDELFNFSKNTFAGNTISKYQKLILSYPPWNEHAINNAKEKNIQTDDAIFDLACYLSQKNEPENFYVWYGVEYYESVITKDGNWMATINEKSQKNQIPVQEQIIKDATYLFENEKPVAFYKYKLIKENKQLILSDDLLKSAVLQKAKAHNLPFEEMLDVYCGYITNIQFSVNDPEENRILTIIGQIKSNEKWFHQVSLKAKEMNKPLDEILRKEATYVLIHKK